MSAGTTHTAFNPNYLDDSAITQALADGQHSPVLQAFFGTTAFVELAELAKRALATQSDKHAPLVYLLPGLLGSRLGVRTAKAMELLWLDPSTLATGKLQQLRIGQRRSIRPVGAMLPGYLKLKLLLQCAGFRVKFHAYDWRRSILELGRRFAEELLHEPEGEIMLVAHSMGGLLARAALRHAGGSKVTRLVQMGAPNQGSFALVQALRGCYPTVRKLGAVDHLHTADMLAQQVFRSFYSFYEMLPAGPHTPELDLFDARQWPRDALAPRADRLKLGRRLSKHLAAADRRCHIVAGTDQPTVTSVRVQNQEFVFQFSNAGDGTVPLALATWRGARHWYVREAHGQLPRNTQVCQAVIDILRSETTGLLSQQYADTHHEALERSESELRGVLNCKVRWDQLPLNERRDLLEPVISPVFVSLCTGS